MKITKPLKSKIKEVAEKLDNCRKCPLHAKNGKTSRVPNRVAIQEALEILMGILFPGCYSHKSEKPENRFKRRELEKACRILFEQIKFAFRAEDPLSRENYSKQSIKVVAKLLEELPIIHDTLQDDIIAAYEGDPAAKSILEVVISYPAIYAITAYRIAHVLYEEKVPIIPRVITEIAHSKTGIDIHPGAKIGRSFFIDHGTGVVIGETTVIGNNVKIYQGVTLGALSFPKDKEGRIVKGIKRHPNVEDNVTIYSNATILGGNTTIGRNSEIGGNVWLTHSIPPNTKVYNTQPKPIIKPKSINE